MDNTQKDIVENTQYKICTHCRINKPVTEFYLRFDPYNTTYRNKCKKCHYRVNANNNINPIKRLLKSSRTNARAKGVAHHINLTHLYPYPEICKYLGVTLDYTKVLEEGGLKCDYGPSIDRIDPSKGYIPGNVQIISNLANRMKHKATIEELITFAENIIMVHSDYNL